MKKEKKIKTRNEEIEKERKRNRERGGCEGDIRSPCDVGLPLFLE